MFLKLKSPLFLVAVLFLSSCNEHKFDNKKSENNRATTMVNPTNKVLLSSEIVWQKLNPARGDQSPQAGTIWGDRYSEVATGFLAKFVDGFSSPPHIHNVTYRAVVIKGAIHNDDPDAEKMWMKQGSFWTQPQGEAHITAAMGEENIALVEIDEGPYLVKPIEEAYDNGERPINIDVSNIVWLSHDDTSWIESGTNAELSFLWDDNESIGIFIKLSKGFNGKILSDGTVVHGVVIAGELNYVLPQSKGTKTLDPGSSFSATAKAVHSVSSLEREVLLYIRTNGGIKIKSS